VLRIRFGFLDGREHTLAETGGFLGVSRERTRQIEKRALEKLRTLVRVEESGGNGGATGTDAATERTRQRERTRGPWHGNGTRARLMLRRPLRRDRDRVSCLRTAIGPRGGPVAACRRHPQHPLARGGSMPAVSLKDDLRS